MSAYAELLETGAPGPLTLALLRRLGAQIGRTSRFPPPDGHRNWTKEAVDELICALFVAKRDLLVGCLATANDAAALERLLLTAIQNWLKDQAKATEVGKLRRRLQNVLGGDPRFVLVKDGRDYWALTGHAQTIWQGNLVRLHAAAHKVRGVQVTRWNPSGPTPQDTKDKLISLAHAVLAEAGGCVSAQDLSVVLAARTGLWLSPTFVSLSVDGWDEPDPSADTEAAALTATAAQQIWSSLSPDERVVVPLLAGNPDDVAAQLDVGPETAAAIQAAVREKLRLATVDDDERDGVVASLLRLAHPEPGVTSSEPDTWARAHPVRQDAVS